MFVSVWIDVADSPCIGLVAVYSAISNAGE